MQVVIACIKHTIWYDVCNKYYIYMSGKQYSRAPVVLSALAHIIKTYKPPLLHFLARSKPAAIFHSINIYIYICEFHTFVVITYNIT